MKSTFYGWWIVTACMLFVTVSWSLGIFGMGVYVYALTDDRGFSISTVSTAVTTAYVVSALLMISVGHFIVRRGPRLVVGVGMLAMALGVAFMPYCRQPWHLYATFLTLGLGMACLSILLPSVLAFSRKRSEHPIVLKAPWSSTGTGQKPYGIAWRTKLSENRGQLIWQSVHVDACVLILLIFCSNRDRQVGNEPNYLASNVD